MTTNEGRKICPPGTTKAAGNRSNPIAARKMGAAKRERRHVRKPVTTFVHPHIRANSAARGEVLEVLGQAAQNVAIPARPATRKTPASKVVPKVLLSISPSRRLTTLGVDRRASPQPTAAAWPPCRLWQLQDCRDDSTGLPARSARWLAASDVLSNEKSPRGE